ncbi:hypothetical protein R3P38DRAFT_3171193 [Favolaschia claudopus]|uniref:Uncharacterized protein n=1 Tax=Favolaschia claudopus TaxID=2862362 RepID=A0AAW0DQM6_9AGAR
MDEWGEKKLHLTALIAQLCACTENGALGSFKGTIQNALTLAAEQLKDLEEEQQEQDEDVEEKPAAKPKPKKGHNKRKEGKEGKESHASEQAWVFKSNTEKEEAIDKACQEMLAFILKGTSIPAGTRCLLKLVPEVVPECAFVSRKLTEHIFCSKSGGRVRQQDSKGNKYQIHGVPYTPDDKKSANRERNALSCGCDQDEAFVYFMFFKNAVITSCNTKIQHSETMLGDPLGTRHRGFVVQTLKAVSLTVDDLYVGNQGLGGPEYVLGLVGKVAAHFRLPSLLAE